MSLLLNNLYSLSVSSSFILNESIISSNSGDFPNKRHQSDSSTVSSDTNKEEKRNRFNSADSIQYTRKVNNLLKLSLMNSPNSPLHSSSMNNTSLLDSVFLEAKWIAEKIDNRSFEDINNISQNLIDTSNVSLTDADLEQLRISFLENNPLSPKPNTSSSSFTSDHGNMENIQKTLNRIKKEKMDDEDHQKEKEVEVKKEVVSPINSSNNSSSKELEEIEVEDILLKIKNLFRDNNKDEAKKRLQKLNELLTESPQAMQKQPMIRQDTFAIDPITGQKKYSAGNSSHSGEGDVSNNCDLMEQLTKLLSTNNVDVSSLNLSGGNGSVGDTKVVVIMPKMPSPVATPVKQSSNTARRSSSMSLTQKPQSALKAIDNKKLSTPMKHSTTSSTASRRSSFTAPRNVTKPQSNPYDQKLSMGAVRKSLMPSMDKTPVKHNLSTSPQNRPKTIPTIRRSTSMKASVVPSVKLTEATPTKIRPVTSSTQTPSKFSLESKSTTPVASRKLSTAATSRVNGSRLSTAGTKATLLNNRPITKKTDFKTPYGSSTKKSSTSPLNGSLV